jgi:hypothetical protein
MSACDEGYLPWIAANPGGRPVLTPSWMCASRPSARHSPAGARAGLSGRRGSIAPVLVNYADSIVKEFCWR